MIRVIDLASRPRAAVHGGHLTSIVGPATDGTRVDVSIRELDPGHAFVAAANDRSLVAYATGEGRGVYLEPGEQHEFTAGSAPLRLLLVSVPKHRARPPLLDGPAAGYTFIESELRAFVDEHLMRERTFWVNQETGLSRSWDLQIGRMRYAPNGYSPRHVHHASPTSPVTPEHFYLIERGTGDVRFDGGSLPVAGNTLVWIPAGEWHQLAASATGFDYIEFQAPFDFVTTMADPRGKHWYIKGTDDGTGRPKPWVQS